MKSEADCFADEIAIDFPSVGHFVARVRKAFLAGDDSDGNEPLTQELTLSSDEAYRGAVVPLELTLRGTCDRCGGRGETWSEPCLTCQGTGDLLVSRWLTVSVPPRVADGTRLHYRLNSLHERSVRVQIRVAILER